MGDLDTFKAKVNSLQSQLVSLNDINTQFTQGSLNSATYNSQNDYLTGVISELNQKLERLQTVSDTYNREYMDRLADKPGQGFWTARGVSSLDDWVLFIFFTMYGFISLGLIVLAFLNGGNSLINGLVVMACAISLGIMIMAVIVRFG